MQLLRERNQRQSALYELTNRTNSRQEIIEEFRNMNHVVIAIWLVQFVFLVVEGVEIYISKLIFSKRVTNGEYRSFTDKLIDLVSGWSDCSPSVFVLILIIYIFSVIYVSYLIPCRCKPCVPFRQHTFHLQTESFLDFKLWKRPKKDKFVKINHTNCW